jgi:hypothetical protein
MSYIGQLFGYGKPAASSPPDPELTPGWEVYKNQRGEILYGNNLIKACQFNAPLAQVSAAQSQAVSSQLPLRPISPTTLKEMQQDEVMRRYFGGLKRKQSKCRRKRMQSRRKQSIPKRMQSRRRS